MKTKNASRKVRQNLTREISFESQGWSGIVPDTLLTDEAGNWFLAFAPDSESGSSAFAPLPKKEFERPEPVTVGEALAWYSKCIPFAPSFTGDLSRLTADAARQLAR